MWTMDLEGCPALSSQRRGGLVWGFSVRVPGAEFRGPPVLALLLSLEPRDLTKSDRHP